MSRRRRIGLIAIACYALLLVVSCVVRRPRARSESLHDLPQSLGFERATGFVERDVLVQAVSGDRLTSRSVRLAFTDFAGPNTATDALSSSVPIVMIHGSPGQKGDFERLGPLVAAGRRVLTVDLPGFGGSTHGLPDYSFRAHARYVIELLDLLGIQRAHLLGYSMGGGVVLNAIDIAPERVASLTMLSAIGAQEMELTGNYYVNHLVHGVQLGGLWLLREGTPHMGLLDDSTGMSYARNFYDSDQRPLRDIMRRVEIPTLILQGERDPLVPAEAAREHHRLIPQSELVLLSGNHFMPFTEPGMLVDHINDFLARVDRGEGVDRSHAKAEAIQASAVPFDARWLPRLRGIALFVTTLVIAGATVALPELGAVSAGIFLGHDRIGIVTVILALLLGLAVRRSIVRLARFAAGVAGLARPAPDASLARKGSGRKRLLLHGAILTFVVAVVAVVTRMWF